MKWSEVAQSCPTLCNPVNCSLPGSSVHGIFQARVLEWVAISFSRGSSRPRDWTQVSLIVGRRFTFWAVPTAKYLVHAHWGTGSYYYILQFCVSSLPISTLWNILFLFSNFSLFKFLNPSYPWIFQVYSLETTFFYIFF